MAVVQPGAAPSLRAMVPVSVANATLGCPPCAWAMVAGTTWHSAQAIALASGPSCRWAWWAPTWSELACRPRSSGGAAALSGTVSVRRASPWQTVQAAW